MSFQAYLDTIKAKTGLGPAEFRAQAEEKGYLQAGVKTGVITAWLKEEYGLGQGHAMALVATFKGKPADDERVDKQFSGAKAHWRETFDALVAAARGFGPVELAPTDSYVSLTSQGRKFAVVAATADRLDVGLKLKGEEPVGRFEAAGSWNAMVTHRVRVTDPAQVDAELLDALRRAYDAA